MPFDVHLKGAGIAAEAKSPQIQRAVAELAERVAENVRAQGIEVEGEPGNIALPVKVASYLTDRARSTVTIAHPSGLAVQAKHGVLTRAAAEVGLEVKSR